MHYVASISSVNRFRAYAVKTGMKANCRKRIVGPFPYVVFLGLGPINTLLIGSRYARGFAPALAYLTVVAEIGVQSVHANPVVISSEFLKCLLLHLQEFVRS